MANHSQSKLRRTRRRAGRRERHPTQQTNGPPYRGEIPGELGRDARNITDGGDTTHG